MPIITSTAPITSSITSAVSQARWRMRLTATANASSTCAPNCVLSSRWWLNACTTLMFLIDSPTKVPTSATLSWLVRDSTRTRRPKIRIGATTSGTLTMTISVSLMSVTNSQTMPPIMISRLRSASDTDEPITVCSSVVSVVMRDWISPLRLASK